MYTLLGLRDEDETAKKEREDVDKSRADASNSGVPNMQDIEGAAIPVNDIVDGELNLNYDPDNPIMAVGTKYRSMVEFRLAVRQYAINKEFELGIEATHPSRYRGFCLGGDCPWNIYARPIYKGANIIEVIVLNDIHSCTSSSRRKTTTATCSWVAFKALPILRKEPNMGCKELQLRLQDIHKCTIGYDTVYR